MIVYCLIELLSVGGLYLMRKLKRVYYLPVDVMPDWHKRILTDFVQGKTNYIIFEPVLGWTIRKNGRSELYQANSAGIRSSREYALEPSQNIFRLASFGDSFTHGDDVSNDSTWQAIMEAMKPDWEVLNFGVEGFGLDQAYLRYISEGKNYHPRVVLIGFMSEDIYRHVNVYRPFYFTGTGIPLTKPRFYLDNDSLRLFPNPIRELDGYRELIRNYKEVFPRIGKMDYFYRHRYKRGKMDFLPSVRFGKIFLNKLKENLHPGIVWKGFYNEESEAFQITIRLFDRFCEAAIRNNSFPIILIFPRMEDILRYRKNATCQYDPLVSYLRSRGYFCIDLMEAFHQPDREYPVQALFRGHYSPLGNRLVAQHILASLGDLTPQLLSLSEPSASVRISHPAYR